MQKTFGYCLFALLSFDLAAAEPRPLVVGHRGLMHAAPECTLAGFRACLALRVGFEFDVRRCQDGTLVCLHDPTLDRTTDGRGQLADLTFDQVKKIDAGSRFDPAFRNEVRSIKQRNKEQLARYIEAEHRVPVDRASMFDVQVKRLHEYKRQLLNLLHIVAVYLRLKKNPDLEMVPRTFIFGGK